MKRIYELKEFQVWLASEGFAAVSQSSYLSRTRAILSAMRCPGESKSDLEVVTTDYDSIMEYVNGLKPSLQATTASAWRTFCKWLAVAGIKSAPLTDGRKAGSTAPLRRVKLPLPVAAAVWHVASFRGMNPGLLLALKWGHIRPDVEGKPTIYIDRDRQWTFNGDSLSLKTLKGWAVTCSDDQPFIPGESGGSEPIDPEDLRAILSAGRGRLLPELIPDPMERIVLDRIPVPCGIVPRRSVAGGQYPPPPPPVSPPADPVESEIEILKARLAELINRKQ